MKIKDLTAEQIKEIARLAYPFPEWMRSDIEVKYQPYDKAWLDDAQEFWFAKFDGITFGDKVDTYRLYIYPSLDLSLDAIRTNPDNMTDKQKSEPSAKSGLVFLGPIPIRNQHAIQKKFIEWNLEPTEQ